MKQRKQRLAHLQAACCELLDAVEGGSKPRIAAWGLVKAGKSSLLNMLSGHVAKEFFATGVVRTTLRNKELETERYVLVDTPGLGIDKRDSAEAFKGLDAADVTVFVHSPPGELDQEEIDLLGQVNAAYGAQTDRRLVLVLSQLDKFSASDRDLIRTRILAQMQEFFGLQPACFEVSSTRYGKGVNEGKTTLELKSGIPALRDHLDALSQEIEGEIEGVRAVRRAQRRAEVLRELDKAIDEERELIARLQQPFIEKVRDFNLMMAELRRSFTSQRADIDYLQRKLENI